MSDKFIHHDSFCAISCDPGGGQGRYDVIEDDHGIYVTNADEGSLGGFDTLAEATKEAERLADQYDADLWLADWRAAVADEGELRGFIEWLKDNYEDWRDQCIDDMLKAWQRDGYDRLLPESLARRVRKFAGISQDAQRKWNRMDVRAALANGTY